ncbi:hypothetical protein M9435_005419 [Picochlorum sp. BPE23]|nr:hypothetical protein M9435_005419 [Picochlorum sp. BPE23]
MVETTVDRGEGEASGLTRRVKRQTNTSDAATRLSTSRTKSKKNAGSALRKMKEEAHVTRYLLSGVMHIAVLGAVVRMMYIGGVIDLMESYYDAWAPWVVPCGLLETKEYVIFSEHIVGRHGMVAGGIHVRGEIIAGTFLGRQGLNRSLILERLVGPKKSSSIHILDYKDYVVGPGLIDVHVHMNDPGRAEWETMYQATQAAAAGGVTMVVDMPLNSDPVTTTKKRVLEKIRIGAGKNSSFVQVGVWAGLVPENAGNPSVLKGLVRAGAFGFKAFMAHSGINDFEKVSIDDIEAALPVIRSLDVPLLVHAELELDEEEAHADLQKDLYSSWLHIRPPEMERRAVQQLIDALEKLEKTSTNEKKGFRIHVVHISDDKALQMIVDAKKRHLPITVETCPHYLLFSKEMIPKGATEFKCAPPIRDAENRDALRRGVLRGDIDGVSSDHSPSPESMKMKDTGDFLNSWGGISVVQYSLPATWESLVSADPSVSPFVLHAAFSGFPASLLGMEHLKGRISDGKHADLVVWDPKSNADTSREGCYQTQKLSPYMGRAMRGKVVSTFVMGSMVYDSGVGVSATSCGTSIAKKSIRKKRKS